MPPAPPDPLGRTRELVDRAQHGDAEALERLLERYYERVRRIVRVRLGPRLRVRVESGDILQETFATAIARLDRFEMRDEGSFIHWLGKLAERQIHAAADHHGAHKRDARREVPLAGTGAGDGEDAGLDPAASGLLPQDLADRGERQALLERCLHELPEAYRELILLRDYAGASWEAVAEHAGRPSADAARMMHAKALVELGRRVRAATDAP